MKKIFIVPTMAALVLSSLAASAGAQGVKVGGIINLTGPPAIQEPHRRGEPQGGHGNEVGQAPQERPGHDLRPLSSPRAAEEQAGRVPRRWRASDARHGTGPYGAPGSPALWAGSFTMWAPGTTLYA